MYVPGISVGALYSPTSFVVRVRATTLCVSTMVTVATGMTPPLWSVTIPRIRPKLVCENRGRHISSTPSVTPSTSADFLTRTQSDDVNLKLMEPMCEPFQILRIWPIALVSVHSDSVKVERFVSESQANLSRNSCRFRNIFNVLRFQTLHPGYPLAEDASPWVASPIAPDLTG